METATLNQTIKKAISNCKRLKDLMHLKNHIYHGWIKEAWFLEAIEEQRQFLLNPPGRENYAE